MLLYLLTQISILQPTDQRIISTFKSYDLQNTVHKATSGIVIVLMSLGKVNSKLTGKDSPLSVLLRIFVIHTKKSKYQYEQEFRRS